MANKEHLKILKKGVKAWNEWRKNNFRVKPNLKKADLSCANLEKVNLKKANLSFANLKDAFLFNADLTDANLENSLLEGAYLTNAILTRATLINGQLIHADLRNANLNGAYLNFADLRYANLNNANLIKANLQRANLIGTELKGANLSSARLEFATLEKTNLTKAVLTNCSIYGISVWDVKLDQAEQKDLLIAPYMNQFITVDNLEIAQFIYLLINNEKIRSIIDTITSKVVLILGRFKPERKAILDSIREELRKKNYSPVLFDFEIPKSRDITETILTLAGMARFVIADITDARSIPQELTKIVPSLPSVPVQPILLYGKPEYGMFEHFKRFPWVLDIYNYKNLFDLMKNLREKIIPQVEAKVTEVRKK